MLQQNRNPAFSRDERAFETRLGTGPSIRGFAATQGEAERRVARVTRGEAEQWVTQDGEGGGVRGRETSSPIGNATCLCTVETYMSDIHASLLEGESKRPSGLCEGRFGGG